MLLGAASQARADAPRLDPKADAEIEAALPEIEAARVGKRLTQIHPRYLDRADRAGRVLAAWSLPDDQESWNALRALSTFGVTEPWSDVGTAAVYLRWKTWDQAGAALARARKLAPNLAEAAVLEGDLGRGLGDTARAEKAYREALVLRPGDGFAHEGLGLLALAANKPDEAEREFLQAQQSYRDDSMAARGLADARLARGDAAGALAALDDLHRLTPGDTAPWLESGRLRLKQGKPSEAARDFEQARKLGSADPDLLKLLSQTYQAQGRTDDERHLINELVAQGVADSRVYARRAALREATDLPGALSDLRKSVDLDKNDLDVALQLAQLTAKSGDLSAAIGLYRDLLPRKPETKPELLSLEQQAQLLPKPLKGTVTQINAGLSSELTRLYHRQLKQTPGLHGTLKLRVTVNAQGEAEGEEFIEDSVKVAALAANLRWNAHDAHYPPQANRYVFKFGLQP